MSAGVAARTATSDCNFCGIRQTPIFPREYTSMAPETDTLALARAVWSPRSDSVRYFATLQKLEEHIVALTVGQTAPDFTLKDQNQKEVKLSDFAGKKRVVLMFYPLDWSPTCTQEHACFVNDMKNFDTLEAEVLGVSVDSVWSHKAYAEKMGIKYSLLADFHPKGAMSEKYDVYLGEKGITGRSIIIIDKQGKVAWAKNYDIPVVPDVKEVATALQSVN